MRNTDCPPADFERAKEVDLLAQSTSSEQRVALLGCIAAEPSPTLSMLRERLMGACGYAPSAYFLGTLRDQIAPLPTGVIDRSDDKLDHDTIVSLTEFGQRCAGLGGLLLDRISTPSGNISLVHIYGNMGSNAADRKRGKLSGRWKTYKLLDMLLKEPVDNATVLDTYKQFNTPVTPRVFYRSTDRLRRNGIITPLNKGSSAAWSLTEIGYEVAQGLTDSMEKVAEAPTSPSLKIGLALLANLTAPDGCRRTTLPLLIKRAKRAANRDTTLLQDVNEQLRELAPPDGTAVTLSTIQIAEALGTEIGYERLKRIFETVPGSVVRAVEDRRGAHGSRRWTLQAHTPASSYR